MTLLRLEWRTAHYTPLFAETDPALLSFRQKGDDPEEGKDAVDFVRDGAVGNGPHAA
jgi:hypothetical protein